MRVFRNEFGSVRVIWSIALFFALLSVFTAPLIVFSVEHKFEIPLIVQAFLIFIVSILCQKIVGIPIHQLMGKFDLNFLRTFLTGSLMGSLLMLLPALILFVGGWVTWQAKPVGAGDLGMVAFVIFSGAIAEEILFRGFLFQRILHGWGIRPAQLIMSLLFLLTHLNNPGMNGSTQVIASLNIFIASLVFGIAYIRTQTLGMAIGLHFMANFTQGVILGFNVSGEKDASLFKPAFTSTEVWITGGNFGLEASVFGLAAIVCLAFLITRKGFFPVLFRG